MEQSDPMQKGADCSADAWRKHRSSRQKALPKKANDAVLRSSRGPSFSPVQQSLDSFVLTPDEENIYRVGLVARLRDGYLPLGATSSFGEGIKLAQGLAGRSALIEAANDGLALLFTGSVHNDPRVLYAARRKHVTTIQLLRQKLEKPQAAFDEIMSAAQVLLASEMFSSHASGPTAWTSHVTGLLGIVQQYHRQSETTSLFCKFLFWQLRHICLMQALVSRKAIAFDSSLYRAGENIWPPDSCERLVQVACCVPAALEDADNVARSKCPDSDDVNGALQKLELLRSGFQQWLEAYQSEDAAHWWYVDSSATYSSERTLISSCPAQRISFSSFESATFHAFAWSCLLLIEQAMFSIVQSLDCYPARELEPIESQADSYVNLLCGSIAYFVDMTGGVISKATALKGTLHFTSRWFEKTDRCDFVQWLHDVEREMMAEMPSLQWHGALLAYSFLGMVWRS